MSEPGWSDWRPLPASWSPAPAVLAETLDGGQAFRWTRKEGGSWTGLWSDCAVQLRLASSRVEWRAPDTIADRVAAALPRYLGFDVDWSALTDALPWRSDPHLAECMRAYPGLRLLRQPFGETLLGFLCSATKQIVQIKQMMALLAERHGSPLLPSSTVSPQSPTRTNRLPTWEELAQIPEKELRACLLGFRARYIHQTAQYLTAHPGWLNEVELLPYAAAKERLVELPGVGEKVADCVLLFGAGKLEAFPVDVWVLKSLAKRYGLNGWKPAQLAQFGRVHFGPLAGYAQQYLFSWERKHGGR